MRMRALVLALGGVFWATAAFAQATTVVTACGAPTYTAGQAYPPTQDIHGNGCTTASGGAAGSITINQATPGTTNGVVANGILGNSASVNSANELFVSQEGTQLFFDTFDSSLDTTNRWTATNGGTGLAPVYSTASATLNGGTTANSYSKLISQPSFAPSEPGWLYNVQRINIEFPVLTTGYRFWGVGTTPGSPTIASPVTDGCGFDIGLTGKLSAVCYAAGTRNLIQDLSSSGNNKQPADSNAHKYYVRVRGDLTYWYIDDATNVAVASMLTGANGPNVNALPILDLVVSNSGAAEMIVLNGVSESDTARNNVQLSDGTFPWRKGKIDANGNVATISSPTALTTTPTSATITTHLTFQSVLASSATRKGCLLQNNSTDTIYIFFGANGSATTAASFQLTPGGAINCATQAGGVLTDNISATSLTNDGSDVVTIASQ